MQALTFQMSQFSGLHCRESLGQGALQARAPQRIQYAPLTVRAQEASRKERTQKRHHRIRNKVEGRPDQPRLAVYRSNNHIYAQVVDDEARHTLVAVSTMTKEIKEQLTEGSHGGANKDAATLVGKKIAELCLAKNITKVCFDRGGKIYHGRVRALAEAAREQGLVF